MDTQIGPQAALIYSMVLAAVADSNITDREMRVMEDIVVFLPAFQDFQVSTISSIATECAELLTKSSGLDTAVARIKNGLPQRLRETAYALACDVVAADGKASQEELLMLEMLRDELDLDHLTAAGIERGTRARFTSL